MLLSAYFKILEKRRYLLYICKRRGLRVYGTTTGYNYSKRLKRGKRKKLRRIPKLLLRSKNKKNFNNYISQFPIKTYLKKSSKSVGISYYGFKLNYQLYLDFLDISNPIYFNQTYKAYWQYSKLNKYSTKLLSKVFFF